MLFLSIYDLELDLLNNLEVKERKYSENLLVDLLGLVISVILPLDDCNSLYLNIALESADFTYATAQIIFIGRLHNSI